ncbi:hypothetical protein [Bradyrhizobium daqingense]|nr:hypothetical protein [Bradyrhizobium daqingense]
MTFILIAGFAAKTLPEISRHDGGAAILLPILRVSPTEIWVWPS